MMKHQLLKTFVLDILSTYSGKHPQENVFNQLCLIWGPCTISACNLQQDEL